MNDSKENPQLPLLPEDTALSQLDKRVRSTYIGGEQYVSVLDILEFHGNKKNPRQAWKNILKYMQEKQGFSNSPDFGQYAFEGKDGKRKAATPIVNLDGFMRLIQSADVPEWEDIRNWQAKLSGNELKSKAQRKRDSELERYQKAGLGDKPEVVRFAAYNEALKEYAALKSAFTRVCDSPDWRVLANEEYQALFGMMANQLKAVLKNENIRQSLGTDALETMTFAERRLRSVLSTQQNLSNDRIQEIIKVVVAPLGIYLRGLSQLEGKDMLTGKPLLNDKSA